MHGKTYTKPPFYSNLFHMTLLFTDAKLFVFQGKGVVQGQT